MKHNIALIALCLGTLPGILSAQNISTTADLKRVCETAPNNVVTVTQSINIESGAQFPNMEQISTGCTLIFNENTGINMKQVAVKFAGPLTLQSSRKAEATFFESYVEATSMNLPLFGRGSKILVSQSRLVANAGNFAVSVWEDALVDITDTFGPTPSLPVIQSAGLFSIWTDASSFSSRNARFQAASGFDFNLADELPTMKMEEVDMVSANGAIAIYGTTRDIKLEISKGLFSAPGGVRITLTGRNSGLGVKDLRVQAGSGPVRIGVGSYSASANVSQSNIQTTGTITLEAGSFSSTLEADGNTMNAGGAIRVSAQSQWASVVAKNNTVTSPISFVVAAGANGTCDASGNNVTSPLISLCR
jgi:hypothetical protein